MTIYTLEIHKFNEMSGRYLVVEKYKFTVQPFKLKEAKEMHLVRGTASKVRVGDGEFLKFLISLVPVFVTEFDDSCPNSFYASKRPSSLRFCGPCVKNVAWSLTPEMVPQDLKRLRKLALAEVL